MKITGIVFDEYQILDNRNYEHAKELIMNSADLVYTQPELKRESTDSAYTRFLPELNLTKCMIIPHYQEIKNQILDEKRLFEDITYPDSYGQKFYALPDGSYLYSKNGVEKIYEEVYLIQNGNCVKICSDGEEIALHLNCS